MTWTADPDSGPPPDPGGAPVRTGHVRWRRVMLWTLAPLTALMGVGSVVGAGTMALAGVAVGGAAAGGFVLWRYPHIRHHFAPFGPRWQRPQHGGGGQKGFSSQWTRNWRRGGGGGLRSPFRAGSRRSGAGGRAGLLRGRPGRHRTGAAFRSPGSGRRLGRSGTGLGRSRRGTGAGRGLGTGRRRGSGRSGTSLGGSRRRSGGLSGGSGRSRGLLRGSGRSRRGTGASAGGRRSRFSPFRRGSAASRRRSMPGTGPRTRAGGGGRPSSPRPRRRLFRPSTWRRRRAAGTPGGRRQGAGTPKAGRKGAAPAGWTPGWPAGWTGGQVYAKNRRKARRNSRHRRLTRPQTWFRGRNGRAGYVAGPGGPVRRRRAFRPSTWRSPGPRRPRSLRHPSTWFRRRGGQGTPGKPAGWTPGWPEGWTGGQVYARSRRDSQSRRSRRQGRKLHRARVRAMRARRSAAFPPRRRWFTPWRGRPGSAGGRPGWQARYRRFRAAGGIRGAVHARNRRRQLARGRLVRPAGGLGWARHQMTLRHRIARRWQMRRRVHRGLGIGPQQRPLRVHWAQLRANIASRRNRRRALRKLRGRPLTWRRRALNVLTLAGLRSRLSHRGTRVRRPLRERLRRLRPGSGWLRAMRPRRSWLPRRRPGSPPRPLAEIGWLAWARRPLSRLDQRRSDRWMGRGRHRAAPPVDPEARPAPAPERNPGTPRPGAPLSAPTGNGTSPGHGPGTSRTGDRTMASANPGTDAANATADEISSTLGNWTPVSGPDIDRTLAALPEFMDAQRHVFTHMADVLDAHASEHPVTEQLRQAAGNFQGMRDQFEHVYQVHRVQHDQGMRRYEDPKPGEATWNVPGGSDDGSGIGYQLVAEAESAVRSKLGGWEPEDGADFDGMLNALPNLMDSQRDIFTRLGEHMAASSEPGVVDAMQEAASHFDGMSDAFSEVYGKHRVEHAWQMKRYEEPKPDEQVWNVLPGGWNAEARTSTMGG